MKDYHHSMINAKFNIAKVLSRHYSPDTNEKRNMLIESKKVYDSII
jgi:hypothetical protein